MDRQFSLNRWNYLMAMADALSMDLENDRVSAQSCMEYLASIEEVFGGADPVDAFPELTVVYLCRALRRSLENLSANPLPPTHPLTGK